MTTNQTITNQISSLRRASEAVLRALVRDRDRQILSRRFGLGIDRRHTLEEIGRDFGVTRERVRQIEKAALSKLQGSHHPDIAKSEAILSGLLSKSGGLMPVSSAPKMMGLPENELSYLQFMANLASNVDVVSDNDRLEPTIYLSDITNQDEIYQQERELVDTITRIAKPVPISTISSAMNGNHSPQKIENLARASKTIAEFEGIWGLISWPSVNPKSIRDKTYLVLTRHKQPLHFGEIADEIHRLGLAKRPVTVQAVHNELIKDPRFVLIGRGIYALADWGYTPGTVADIIAEVLREESPLHKDEIVRRVLSKRQVKTTTIVLNLQEKDQFQRIAKATYKLAAA